MSGATSVTCPKCKEKLSEMGVSDLESRANDLRNALQPFADMGKQVKRAYDAIYGEPREPANWRVSVSV